MFADRRFLALTACTVLLAGCASEEALQSVGSFKNDPAVRIVSPTEGQLLPGPDVTVQLAATGTFTVVKAADATDKHKFGEGHFHLFLDTAVTPAGEVTPMGVAGITHTTNTTVTLPAVPAGTHKLVVELAYSDHTAYQHSQTSVTFCVAQCGPGTIVAQATPSAAASSAPAAAPSPSPVAGPVTGNVNIDTGDPSIGGAFKPPSVSIKAGEAVKWTWVDPNAPHSATADDGTFDSSVQNKGATFTFTFPKAGTYKYHCSVHPQMLGTVNVS